MFGNNKTNFRIMYNKLMLSHTRLGICTSLTMMKVSKIEDKYSTITHTIHAQSYSKRENFTGLKISTDILYTCHANSIH